jgi:hypothetical protein
MKQISRRRDCSRDRSLISRTARRHGTRGTTLHGRAVSDSAWVRRDLFPEANVLVPIGSVAARSNTPTSKFVIVTIAPSPQPDKS